MRRALSCVSAVVLLALTSSACAPLHASAVPNPEGPGARALSVPEVSAFPTQQEAECGVILNAQRSNWGAAGKVAGAVAGSCAVGGIIHSALESEGLSQKEVLGLSGCAVVAGAVAVLSTSKVDDLTHEWTRRCAAPVVEVQASSQTQ